MHARITFLAVAAAAWTALPGTVAAASTLTLKPVADAHVDEAAPSTSYGTLSTLEVDGKSRKRAYLRFDVKGVTADAITGARLRLYQSDASPFGGRVAGVDSAGWDETVTWNTRPAIAAETAASFGAVAAKTWYEVDVSRLVTGPGLVAIGIDSANSDGVKWRSRESSYAPQLLIEATEPPAPVDGLTTVAPPTFGSSDPTYYTPEHHLARTASGRLLAIYGRHSSGVQVSWRDPTGTWKNATRGYTATGALNTGTGTGDWPASIAVARDSAGVEHAWAVFGGPYSTTGARPVQLVRLSELDNPAGPVVGAPVAVDPSGRPGYKADLAFETAPDGSRRGAILWGRQTGDTAFETVVAWFTDLDSDAPALHDATVIHPSTSGSRMGTLEPTALGMRAVMRATSSRATVFAHAADAPLGAWTQGSGGMTVLYPAAAALDGGGLVVATETDSTNHVVGVQRFSPAGAPAPVELSLSGYLDPTLATDGSRIWLLAVRVADGYVISREFTPQGGWAASDRVEIGAEGGGNHRWVNPLRRTDGRLSFLVRGPRGSSSSSASAVLAFQRPV